MGKIRTGFAFIGLAIALAGCAGYDTAMQYSDVQDVDFPYRDSNWHIFDKPAEGRLMITPSLGRSMWDGMLSGLTFGVASDISKPEIRRAAQGWLAHTRRYCTITNGYELIKPQWEFTYRCNGGRYYNRQTRHAPPWERPLP